MEKCFDIFCCNWRKIESDCSTYFKFKLFQLQIKKIEIFCKKNVPSANVHFLSTAKMTLDPNTAHPRVALSADRTEMSTRPDVAQVPDNPGRYDTVLAVLGSTGYSKGKNYWEVSVAGKTCYHLGMVSESAPRKGSLSYRPRNGFWTIVLNKQGQLKAIDQRITSIPIEIHPLRIGVLLDYEKGAISFYDAGSRSHLYTFTGQVFTDKIYPFISYCVDDSANPIVLLSPGSTDWIKSWTHISIRNIQMTNQLTKITAVISVVLCKK